MDISDKLEVVYYTDTAKSSEEEVFAMVKKLLIITALMLVSTSSVFLQSRMISFVTFIQEMQFSDPEGTVVWFRRNPYNRSFGVDEEVYLFYRGMSRYTSFAMFQGNLNELNYAGSDFMRVMRYPQESQYFYKDRAFLMIAGILLQQRDDREIPARMLEYFLYISEPNHPLYPTALYWACFLGYLDKEIYDAYYSILLQLSQVKGALVYDYYSARYLEISRMMKKIKAPKKATLYNYRWTRPDTDLFILIEQVMPVNEELNYANKADKDKQITATRTPTRPAIDDGLPPTALPQPEYTVPDKAPAVNPLGTINPNDYGKVNPNLTQNSVDLVFGEQELIRDVLPNEVKQTQKILETYDPLLIENVDGTSSAAVDVLRREIKNTILKGGEDSTKWFDKNKYNITLGISSYEYTYYRGVAYYGRFVNEGKNSPQFAAQALSDFEYASKDTRNRDLNIKAQIYSAAIELFAYGNVETSDSRFQTVLGMIKSGDRYYPTVSYWRLRLRLASKSESDSYKEYLKNLPQATQVFNYASNKFEPLSVMIPRASSEGITIKPIDKIKPAIAPPS